MPQADDKRHELTAELAAREREFVNARTKVERLERDQADGHSMLRIGCILVAITSIGICIGAVVAVLEDTKHVTAGGAIAAVSAGALFATIVAALTVSFYRKRVMPVQDETPPTSNGARSKPSASKRSPSRPVASKP
jgi:hypothetical protein